MLCSNHVAEVMVVSTCDRVEVYAVVDKSYSALTDLGESLAEHSGHTLGRVSRYAYVRYSEAAAERSRFNGAR